MTFNYEQSKLTAYRLISQYGQEMVLYEVVNSLFSPETNTLTQEEISYNVLGLLLDFKENTTGQQYSQDTVLNITDRRVIIAAYNLTYVPKVGDKLLINSKTYLITQVISDVGPANLSIIYELRIKI